MANGEGSDLWHLLHLLWIPVLAVLRWMTGQIDKKADKEVMKESFDSLRDTIKEAAAQQRADHIQTAARLETFNATLLNALGKSRRNE